jgi:cytidylate kinase
MQKISLVITIDGPAGSGKSTVAKQLAQMLGFTYLDTGAMFRAITLKALEDKINLEDENQISHLIENTNLEIESLPSGTKILLNGRDVSEFIRRPEVSRNIKFIAKMPKARSALCQLQRKFAENKKIIAEGRDMGTVVFPKALVKIFLDASLDERVRRRSKDLKDLGFSSTPEEICKEILQRDYEDTHREVAPLRPAEDSIHIDTTGMTLDEVSEKIRQIVLSKISSG